MKSLHLAIIPLGASHEKLNVRIFRRLENTVRIYKLIVRFKLVHDVKYT